MNRQIFCFGGANRVRTDDLLNAIQTRYQLRHNPEIRYILADAEY